MAADGKKYHGFHCGRNCYGFPASLGGGVAGQWMETITPPARSKAFLPEDKSNADAYIALLMGSLSEVEDTESFTIITCDFALLSDAAWYMQNVASTKIELHVLGFPKYKSRYLPTDIEGIATYTRLDHVLAKQAEGVENDKGRDVDLEGDL